MLTDVMLTEPEVLADVRPGQRMLLDDGRLQLEAGGVKNGRLAARVITGGTLRPNKGLNLPDTPLSIPAVTPRDREVLAVAAQAGVDWVALSFVRGPEAADEVRTACKAVGLDVPILAKIERPEAVNRAAAIVAAFDAIMVARGDLGVEIPLERVPTVQKMLIAEARAAGKAVITATDMLDSMRHNPRPTARRPATSPMPSSTVRTPSCSPVKRPSGITRSKRSRACTESPSKPRPISSNRA